MRRLASWALGCVLIANVASADVIALYDAGDDGVSGSSGLGVGATNTAATVADHVTASTFGISPGDTIVFVSQSGVNQSPDSPDNAFGGIGFDVTDDSAFFRFTLTVEDGYGMNLDGISFWLRPGFSPNNSTGYFVRISSDNFADDIASVNSASLPNNNTWTFLDLALSGPTVTGLTGTNIFHINASGPWTGVIIDHVMLEGSIAMIPEPASIALFMTAIGGLFAFRRRLVTRR